MSENAFDKGEIEEKAKEFLGPMFKEFADQYLEGDPPVCYGTGSPYWFCTACEYSSSC